MVGIWAWFIQYAPVCWAHRLSIYYRYLSVCHPIRARSWCTPRKAKLQLLVLACTAVIYSIPRFVEYYTVVTELEHSLCSSCETDLQHSEGILDFLYSKLCWNFELTTNCAADSEEIWGALMIAFYLSHACIDIEDRQYYDMCGSIYRKETHSFATFFHQNLT